METRPGDRPRGGPARSAARPGIGVDELLARDHRARPAAAGRPGRPAQGARSTTASSTPTRAWSSTSASWTARIKPGQKIRLMRGGTEYEVIEIGQFRPAHDAVRRAGGRPGRLLHGPTSRTSSDVHIGDTVTDAANPTAEAAARLQGAEADGLLAACSRSTTTSSRTSARRSASCKLNDSQLHVTSRRCREGLGLRLPLRLPGHAPPRDHPAAAGARQRPRPGADGPERDLRDPQRKGETLVIVTTRRTCPTPGQIEEFREPIVRISFLLPSENIGDHDAAVHRPPRHVRPHRVPQPARGPSSSTRCRWRR